MMKKMLMKQNNRKENLIGYMIMIVMAVLALALSSCKKPLFPHRSSFHEDEYFKYELEYVIHHPTSEEHKTIQFYSHYNSDENGGTWPRTSLLYHKGENHLYIDGLTFKGTDKLTTPYLVCYNKLPITVVGIKKINEE